MTKRVVLVTGGGRGIGAAAAELFCKSDSKVMIMSRSKHELALVAEKCKGLKTKCEIDIFVGDVSDAADVRKVFEKIRKKWGGVNVLVNNAATITVEPFDEISLESWKRTIDVNITGAFLMAQRAFIEMKQDSALGSIINISSLGGISGTEKFPGFCAYSVSKFAIVGLTESMAVEAQPFGVRVNCIAPGAVETKMLNDAAPFLKTNTKPLDIANLILFLANEDQSGSLSGSVIPVNSNLPS